MDLLILYSFCIGLLYFLKWYTKEVPGKIYFISKNTLRRNGIEYPRCGEALRKAEYKTNEAELECYEKRLQTYNLFVHSAYFDGTGHVGQDKVDGWMFELIDSYNHMPKCLQKRTSLPVHKIISDDGRGGIVTGCLIMMEQTYKQSTPEMRAKLMDYVLEK